MSDNELTESEDSSDASESSDDEIIACGFKLNSDSVTESDAGSIFMVLMNFFFFHNLERHTRL